MTLCVGSEAGVLRLTPSEKTEAVFVRILGVTSGHCVVLTVHTFGLRYIDILGCIVKGNTNL